MKPTFRYLIVAISLAAITESFGQPTPGGSDDSPASVAGTPGVADRRAKVNLARLAREEVLLRPMPATTVPASASAINHGIGKHSLFTDSPGPTASFAGLIDDTLQAPPSDTFGAVGPNHLMEVSNYGVHIQDRLGQVISTVTLSNFWGKVGPFNEFVWRGTNWGDVFDTKVLYDHLKERWIFTTLANSEGPSLVLIGASQTSDPTGDWNLYRIAVDPTKTVYFDHADVGYNKDWIVASGFVFRLAGDRGFVRSETYVFNKTNLYAGGSGLYTLFKRTDPRLRQLAPAITFDDTLSTMYLLGPAANCCFPDFRSVNIDSLLLFKVSGQVGSEIFTVGPTIVTSNRWDNKDSFGPYRNFAPQLGSTNKIAIVEGLMRSLVYRNGSLWAVHDGFLPSGGSPTRSAIFWYQISPRGELLQQGHIDDPTGQTFYGYSGLAVNRFDDVLIGYSRFSSSQYVSANYSFRAGTDPPNTLRADTVLKAGEASYRYPDDGGEINRWADTSATVVDPVNDIDFWTIQTYAATPAGGQDRWATWWGRVTPFRIVSVNYGQSGVFTSVRLRFTTEVGRNYRVEQAGFLSTPTQWGLANSETVSGTGSIVEVVISSREDQSLHRFYRVVALP